jgi:hypothetical protein
MQQRQLRLGDILDDYCPRERRVTNHAVVAMVGADVKQTRCTTCDTEHEYKAAKIPRLRRKTETPAVLAAQGFGSTPKIHEPDVTAKPAGNDTPHSDDVVAIVTIDENRNARNSVTTGAIGTDAAIEDRDGASGDDADAAVDVSGDLARDEGPVHRPLIRASLPRTEGQPPPQRPATDFTIRQPAGRQNRFRARPQQGGQFQGNRDKGGFGGASRGGHRPGGRPPQGGMDRPPRRNDSGRKRSR